MDKLHTQLDIANTINELEQLQLESMRLDHAVVCLNGAMSEDEHSQEDMSRYIRRMVQASRNITTRITRNVKEKFSYLTSGVESLEVYIATAEHQLSKHRDNKPTRPTAMVTGGSILHMNSKLLAKDVARGLKITQQTYASIYEAYVVYASKMIDHIKTARSEYQKLDEETSVERSSKLLSTLSEASVKINLELKDRLNALSKVSISGDRQIIPVDRVISPSTNRNRSQHNASEEMRIVQRLDVKNRNRAGRYTDTQEVAVGTIKEIESLITTLRPMLNWYTGLNAEIDVTLVELGTLRELADGNDKLVFDFKWSDDDPMAILYRLYFGSGVHTWVSVIEEGIMSILPHYFKVLYSGTNYAVTHLKSYQEDPNDEL